MNEPTLGERYQHMRDNAEAFVENMASMVAKYESEGNEDMASKLKVWCLTPWQAAIRDDDSGRLWPICEICSKPIKDETERLSSEDGCDFHSACVKS